EDQFNPNDHDLDEMTSIIPVKWPADRRRVGQRSVRFGLDRLSGPPSEAPIGLSRHHARVSRGRRLLAAI
ncbi:MAG TPA: hypothetical protein VGC82_16745, partial [Rhodopila sp.]